MSDKKFFEATRMMTSKAQDLAAADLLDWKKVELQIRTAAGSGAMKTVLIPPSPIKIRHTDAAVQAARRLTQAGFRAQWVDYRPSPTAPAGDALEIEWWGAEIVS